MDKASIMYLAWHAGKNHDIIRYSIMYYHIMEYRTACHFCNNRMIFVDES